MLDFIRRHARVVMVAMDPLSEHLLKQRYERRPLNKVNTDAGVPHSGADGMPPATQGNRPHWAWEQRSGFPRSSSSFETRMLVPASKSFHARSSVGLGGPA